MYSAVQIARYIINFCYSIGRPVSNLELQKIMYFLQVLFWRVYKKELIKEEFCAWRYGPVIPVIYNMYSGYGGNLIKNRYVDNAIDDNYRDFLNANIRKLESKGPWTLVDMTHAQGTPWYQVYDNGLGDGYIISKELIKEDTTLIN